MLRLQSEMTQGTRETMCIYVGAGATHTSQESTCVFHVGGEQTTWALQAKQMRQNEHVAEFWANFICVHKD